MEKPSLRFLDLSLRHIGLTESVAGGFAEAACVCLDRHHAPPQTFQISDGERFDGVAIADWTTSDARTKNGWANKDDATRDGAYGIAIATMELTRGLFALGRAEIRTGADYYLGTSNELLEDYEEAIRLEVSGTDRCDDSSMKARLKKKIDQLGKGDSNLPGIAVVVGFSSVKVLAADLEQE
jgi:hypothetical protein